MLLDLSALGLERLDDLLNTRQVCSLQRGISRVEHRRLRRPAGSCDASDDCGSLERLDEDYALVRCAMRAGAASRAYLDQSRARWRGERASATVEAIAAHGRASLEAP